MTSIGQVALLVDACVPTPTAKRKAASLERSLAKTRLAAPRLFKTFSARHQCGGGIVFVKGVAVMIKLGKVSKDTQGVKSTGPQETNLRPLFPA